MKRETKNEYHKSINLAVDYINEHLDEGIDLETIASVANVSGFHFHRIFKAYIGEPVGAYVTRLRLENAAGELRIGNKTLTEVAEKTGYGSQHSLSKAFKKHFGVSPSAFKNIETYFASATAKKPQGKLPDLQPNLVCEEAKTLVYIRIVAGYGSVPDYKTAWRKLWQFAKENDILRAGSEFIGLSFDDPNITKAEQCRFYACISTHKAVKPQGEFGTYEIDKGRFAVFTLKGAYSGLNQMYRNIYFNWLPNADVALRNSMSFEKYLNNPDKVNEDDLLTQIYIPIQ